MKRAIGFTVFVASVGWIGAQTGFSAQQTWRGTISDSQCRGDHGGEVNERECTQKCIGNGDKYVLVTDYGKTVWEIVNQKFPALAEYPGHSVNVTGELTGDGIVVSKIEAP
jgi:hypothetical protein